ncbi:MAG TPA: phosphate signaling complex protein PhoU [Candidatus Dormibacteraeota bacterium]|jgi:phosphate transport system protein|nr:phosphate signaling complex protein PhoU [Candidatus Dormibacteraeota bacterium]
MTRTLFDQELEDVRTTASRMGALVEEAIRHSVQALLQHDRDLANSVIEGDSRINSLHLQLREEVFTVMATQAPVARDLRMLVGLQYIGAELERIGDYAARIAKRARRLADQPRTATYVELGQMADLVERQVHDILDAFIRVDKDAAIAVAKRDDDIDRLYRRVFAEQISALAADPDHVEQTQYLLNIAHTLERIGDRVTNVAEDIVFLDTGQVVELD